MDQALLISTRLMAMWSIKMPPQKNLVPLPDSLHHSYRYCTSALYSAPHCSSLQWRGHFQLSSASDICLVPMQSLNMTALHEQYFSLPSGKVLLKM